MEDALRLFTTGTPADRTPAFGETADAQVVTDEEGARRAREQYRDSGIPTIEADATVARHLADGERVLGLRAAASIVRIDEGTQAAVRDEGPLYVTSSRLLHLGARVTSVDLADVEELAMADDRILLTIRGSRGLMLDVSEPRQLRVLLAAARSAPRS